MSYELTCARASWLNGKAIHLWGERPKVRCSLPLLRVHVRVYTWFLLEDILYSLWSLCLSCKTKQKKVYCKCTLLSVNFVCIKSRRRPRNNKVPSSTPCERHAGSLIQFQSSFSGPMPTYAGTAVSRGMALSWKSLNWKTFQILKKNLSTDWRWLHTTQEFQVFLLKFLFRFELLMKMTIPLSLKNRFNILLYNNF